LPFSNSSICLIHRYDEDEAKERKRKRGKHGDVDEMDFDEVWQDDEEAPSEMPGFDEDDKDDVCGYFIIFFTPCDASLYIFLTNVSFSHPSCL